VPSTVKQYVSAIRRAFKLKMLVLSYTSFSALRSDLKKEASKVRKPRTSGPKELIGIRWRSPITMTGATFHDLAALYNALDRTRKPKMLAALERIKRDFSKAAPQLVESESWGCAKPPSFCSSSPGGREVLPLPRILPEFLGPAVSPEV
jgi:hypothetical protein